MTAGRPAVQTPPEVTEQIVTLARGGATLRSIEAATGINRKRLSRVVRAAGLHPRCGTAPRVSREHVQLIRALAARGWEHVKIQRYLADAHRVALSKTYVMQIARGIRRAEGVTSVHAR